MAESGANVKTVLATEIPGWMCSVIFVYDDTVSYWYYGSDIVVKVFIEILPI